MSQKWAYTRQPVMCKNCKHYKDESCAMDGLPVMIPDKWKYCADYHGIDGGKSNMIHYNHHFKGQILCRQRQRQK